MMETSGTAPTHLLFAHPVFPSNSPSQRLLPSTCKGNAHHSSLYR